MSKKTIILSVVGALFSCLSAYGQIKVLTNKDLQKQSDEGRLVIVRKQDQAAQDMVRQIYQKVEQLREMAQQAQLRAQKLLDVAADLERLLQSEWAKREVKENIKILTAEALEVAQAARQMDKEALKEKAVVLRKKAEDLATELKGKALDVRIQSSKDKGSQEIEEKTMVIRAGDQEKTIVIQGGQKGDQKKIILGEVSAQQLQEKARAAWEKAEMEQQKRMLIAVEAGEKALMLKREHQEMAMHMDRLHAELAEVVAAAECAAGEGRHTEAAELHHRAAELKGQIEEHARNIERRHVELEIEQLHGLAHEEERAGHLEKAEAIRREAENLEQKLGHEVEIERQMNLERIIDREFGKIHDLISDLRGEVELLRKEVETLKKKIRGGVSAEIIR